MHSVRVREPELASVDADAQSPRAAIDRKAVELAIGDLLLALGYDASSEALRGTPDRVARAWIETLHGKTLTAEQVLGTQFDAPSYDEVVLLRNVPFFSTCEHHLLPFSGTADVAYVPQGGRVVGLSKLARLVDMHARRLQLQERMTADIANDLLRVLRPAGTAVIVRGRHLCMCARGVCKPDAEMVTSVMLGCFREKPEARAELLALIAKQ